ncbi:MAG: glycosyltransferase family 2 protein, partial [Cyanobacteria bacterium J06641_5]
MTEFIPLIASGLLALQVPAVFILLPRLLRGPGRQPPLAPLKSHPETVGTTSVVVPTLNEAERLGPCLEGLSAQGDELREILVVDSRSTDGTPDLVEAARQTDPRFQLMCDDPLPANWVGRPWALHSGYLATSKESRYVLGIDADTQPQPGLIAALIDAVDRLGYDVISLSPQFILKYPGEWWLQPALLMTLIYRFDSAGVRAQVPERVMANGQCFFCKREVLDAVDGYTTAASSFCDDVTLARKMAVSGYRVGFLDGARVFKVRMYEGLAETWQEWGRSLDLKDASSRWQLWSDLWLLACVQGLPILALPLLLAALAAGVTSPVLMAAAGVNGFLVVMRFGLLLAIA